MSLGEFDEHADGSDGDEDEDGDGDADRRLARRSGRFGGKNRRFTGSRFPRPHRMAISLFAADKAVAPKGEIP
jgi:hypothetical protein